MLIFPSNDKKLDFYFNFISGKNESINITENIELKCHAITAVDM